MTIDDFENPFHDYYEKEPSYVKEMLDLLGDNVSSEDKMYLKAFYNLYMNSLSMSKKNEIIYVSRLFMDKMELVSSEEIERQADYLYHTFMQQMKFDSINRQKFFDIMNECTKVFVGYYKEDELLRSTSNGIVREKGTYCR